MNVVFLVALLLILLATAVGLWLLHRRQVFPLIVHYWAQSGKCRLPVAEDEVHLLLCIADHFEPRAGSVSPEKARSRVERWVREYPGLFGGFRDSDGHAPRHSFFFPIDEYDPEHLDALAGLCRQGFGEVEIHMHHDHDTPESLHQRLLEFREIFADGHGLLARHRQTGETAYGFIHGNWALCNSRPDGRWCGVNNELDILRETGCYADFTMPSAPHVTQTRKINSIYYAADRPGLPRSHDWGTDAGRSAPPDGSLLLIQGPLVLDWTRRKWGLLPRLENGCLQKSQPPEIRRVDCWLRARVQVPTRPDWFFVKLHAHGAIEEGQEVLLGEAMVHFHESLARRARENSRFHYHYVTAREMCNLARAAESGWQGSVADARDFLFLWNGASSVGVSYVPQLQMTNDPPVRH